MKYLLATSLVVGSLATLAPAAQARDGIGAGGAAALGVLGGLAVGGAIASANNGYYPGRPVYRARTRTPRRRQAGRGRPVRLAGCWIEAS